MAILAFAHDQQWEIYASNALMGVGAGLLIPAARRMRQQPAAEPERAAASIS